MKKLVFAILFVLTIVQVIAQVPGFTLGPKVGVTLSKYSCDVESIKADAKSTMHFGIFARLGNKVYVQPELLFMNRSGVLINNDLPASEQTLKLRTIDVPILVGAKLADLELLNVRLFAGPVASMVVNRDIETQNWENALGEDDVRRANWAIQFGGGVDLLMFTIDLRYELGMSDYSKIDAYSIKNNAFTVSVGWKIL